MALIFPDRVIAVRGSVDSMSKAEAAISALLRECLEKDVHSMVWFTCCVCHRPDKQNIQELITDVIVFHAVSSQLILTLMTPLFMYKL